MKVYANETDWYIATDADEAWFLWEENTGEKRSDYPEDEFEEATGSLTVGQEDELDVGSTLADADAAGCDMGEAFVLTQRRASCAAHEAAITHAIRAPASWWARLPCGFLASTEY